MGTNFYLKFLERPSDDMDPTYHVGKRSAAGLFCWDCQITMCKAGPDKVHYYEHNKGWHDQCPKCGKSSEKEDLNNSSAGRELGFNKNLPTKKAGVKSCSSFSWCIHPDQLEQRIKEVEAKEIPPLEKYFTGISIPVIEDEYGRDFTLEQFKQVLEECPPLLWSTDSVGKHFC